MRAQRVVRHQLLGNLFRERRIEPAGDVDCRQLLVFAFIVCFEFRALKIQFSMFGVCLRMDRDVLAGEYVSVHSQADTEHAELDLERAELKADDKGEHKELAAIYVTRGLDPSLAKQVAQQLMAHDALGAHASDELGISKKLRPRPIQAALS